MDNVGGKVDSREPEWTTYIFIFIARDLLLDSVVIHIFDDKHWLARAADWDSWLALLLGNRQTCYNTSRRIHAPLRSVRRHWADSRSISISDQHEVGLYSHWPRRQQTLDWHMAMLPGGDKCTTQRCCSRQTHHARPVLTSHSIDRIAGSDERLISVKLSPGCFDNFSNAIYSARIGCCGDVQFRRHIGSTPLQIVDSAIYSKSTSIFCIATRAHHLSEQLDYIVLAERLT
jgi:hypothetical protein